MKILLVDDSRAIALVTTARLESFGHEVRHAINGQLAIELFQRDQFDLVLMDIEMPGMNGFETTTRIRALEGHEPWAWTPIIFVTATDTDTNLVTAIEAGGDDFISKSVSESVLQAKMKALARIAAMRQRLAQANAKLQDQANRDGLTGLFNRRAMDLRVDALWEDAVRFGKPFSLLMIDVDNFKKYNDFYGHQAGDECLRTVAGCIERVVGAASEDQMVPGAFVARYGGEEFTVVIPEAVSGVHVGLGLGIVEAIAALAIPHEANAAWGIVTVSAGAACMSPAIGSVGQVFRLADELLYKAKSQGRNRLAGD
ncbi:diguanylate cyclase [Azonexus sp.]|uniref:diguanylate cyclase n=1 Tax=Azonexus sp. TaxID=1872668 RepID=UPI0027BAA7F8|nr:diguanylate cyclase [Azonexus sp.]